MANKCYQSLIITGEHQLLRNMADSLLEEGMICFSNILPPPSIEELKEIEMDTQSWCTEFYGTSSDFGRLHRYSLEEEGILQIDFETNWTPCIEFASILSHFYNDVTVKLTFTEPLGGFDGYVMCKDGEIIEEHTENVFVNMKDVTAEEAKELKSKLAQSEKISSSNGQEIRYKSNVDSVEDFLLAISEL